jgi:hypothetical protein
MGKRSDFERVEKDFYRTIDRRAVDALLPLVPKFTRFAEPCTGSGDLAFRLMMEQNICTLATDISLGVDALTLTKSDLNDAECIITNPPWSRKILHPMIEHFIDIAPYTWLLFDADWPHTKQSKTYMKYCSDVVSVGRLIWIPGTTTSGKDNCAWYRFSKDAKQTVFHGRV